MGGDCNNIFIDPGAPTVVVGAEVSDGPRQVIEPDSTFQVTAGGDSGIVHYLRGTYNYICTWSDNVGETTGAIINNVTLVDGFRKVRLVFPPRPNSYVTKLTICRRPTWAPTIGWSSTSYTVEITDGLDSNIEFTDENTDSIYTGSHYIPTSNTTNKYTDGEPDPAGDQIDPPTTITNEAVADAGGYLHNGDYRYRVSFETWYGETLAEAEASVSITEGNKRVRLRRLYLLSGTENAGPQWSRLREKSIRYVNVYRTKVNETADFYMLQSPEWDDLTSWNGAYIEGFDEDYEGDNFFDAGSEPSWNRREMWPVLRPTENTTGYYSYRLRIRDITDCHSESFLDSFIANIYTGPFSTPTDSTKIITAKGDGSANQNEVTVTFPTLATSNTSFLNVDVWRTDVDSKETDVNLTQGHWIRRGTVPYSDGSFTDTQSDWDQESGNTRQDLNKVACIGGPFTTDGSKDGFAIMLWKKTWLAINNEAADTLSCSLADIAVFFAPQYIQANTIVDSNGMSPIDDPASMIMGEVDSTATTERQYDYAIQYFTRYGHTDVTINTGITVPIGKNSTFLIPAGLHDSIVEVRVWRTNDGQSTLRPHSTYRYADYAGQTIEDTQGDTTDSGSPIYSNTTGNYQYAIVVNDGAVYSPIVIDGDFLPGYAGVVKNHVRVTVTETSRGQFVVSDPWPYIDSDHSIAESFSNYIYYRTKCDGDTFYKIAELSYPAGSIADYNNDEDLTDEISEDVPIGLCIQDVITASKNIANSIDTWNYFGTIGPSSFGCPRLFTTGGICPNSYSVSLGGTDSSLIFVGYRENWDTFEVEDIYIKVGDISASWAVIKSEGSQLFYSSSSDSISLPVYDAAGTLLITIPDAYASFYSCKCESKGSYCAWNATIEIQGTDWDDPWDYYVTFSMDLEGDLLGDENLCPPPSDWSSDYDCDLTWS